MEATGTTELEGKLNGTQRLAWFLDLGEAQYMVVTPSLLQLPPSLPFPLRLTSVLLRPRHQPIFTLIFLKYFLVKLMAYRILGPGIEPIPYSVSIKC